MKQLYKKIALLGGAAIIGLSQTAIAGPSIDFGDEGFVQINYALQVWNQTRSYTTTEHDGSSTDTFLRRNRITLMGQKNDLVGFYAQLEAGGDSRSGKDEKSVYYRDAYVTVDYSDSTRFIIGRFKNTFSRENLEACLEPLTLDRGDASYTPFGGTRDTGIALWGNLDDAHFQYRVMVSDGREGEAVPQKSPRVIARVHWSPLDPEFDYGYRGTYLGTRKVFTIGASYDYQPNAAYADASTLSGKKDYNAWTVDAFLEYPLKSGTYTLSAAYLNYSLDNAVNTQTDFDASLSYTELEGFYVKAGYLFPQPIGAGRLQIFARHDGSEYNLNDGSLDRRVNSLGANYYLDGQSLKISAEYQHIDFANPHASNPALQDNHQFTLGFQFIL